MKKFLFGLAVTLSFSSLLASQKMPINETEINGIPVTWIENNKFPVYQVEVYFADGALSDAKERAGETHYAMNLMTLGTKKYSRSTLAEMMEDSALGIDSTVFHEYSLLSFGGLTPYFKKNVNQFCHIFKNANFPENELEKVKNKVSSGLKNISTSPSSLADRAFRMVSMGDGPFGSSTKGRLNSIKNISSKNLFDKLRYFQEKVRKKIYIYGPRSVYEKTKKLITSCRFSSTQKFERKVTIGNTKVTYPKKGRKKIVLVSVPGLNQAQIRVGKYLPGVDIKNSKEKLRFASSFLGDGFTSVLMQELRVKRGLTYGVFAIAVPQKYYGRSIIGTSTKNKSVKEAVGVIRDSLEIVRNHGVTNLEIEKTKKYLTGQHLMRFESKKEILTQIIYHAHLELPLNSLETFSNKIKDIKMTDLFKTLGEVFDWGGMDVVVVGNPSLKSQLGREYNVIEKSYTDFL